jgi:hypothetical protein
VLVAYPEPGSWPSVFYSRRHRESPRPRQRPRRKLRSRTWTFRSKKLHRCIKFRDKGTIHFTRQALPNPHDPPPEFKFTSIKLTDPLLTATVTHYTKSHKCTTRATLSKLSMGQHWTGYSCSFNPSLSASFPWGVSIGGWPNCGNRRQARFTGPPFGRSSHYTQANSGSPTRFGNETINFQAAAPCYGVFVSAVGFINSHTSDSYGANGTHSGKVCLRKG